MALEELENWKAGVLAHENWRQVEVVLENWMEVLALVRMLGLVVVGAVSAVVGLLGNSVVWLWFLVFVVVLYSLVAGRLVWF